MFVALGLSLAVMISGGGCAGVRQKIGSPMTAVKDNIVSDYDNFYSMGTLGQLSLGFGAAGVLANTDGGKDIRDWYQESFRNEGTDSLSNIVKPFGNGMYTVPLFVGTAFISKMAGDSPLGNASGEWAGRSMRTLLVGVPQLLLLQSALGSPRPGEGGSDWQLFKNNNGVSGHSFMGAVPFLSAATMTKNPYLKTILYLGSTLCGLSRINDDKHYASQVAAGWWLAYLAAKSVHETDEYNTRFSVTPAVFDDGVGVSLNVSF